MKIGLIGLGKMGYNLALNMRDHGHEIVAFNRSQEKIKQIETEGIQGAYSLKELVESLSTPRVIWLMIPAGQPVDDMIQQLIPLLSPQDIIIDGGNSFYKDTLRRYEMLQQKKINFVDVGTSGGVEGARYGACTMIGAEEEVFAYLEPLFRDISVEQGYLHTGANGSGHFVKMVHNGIEYGMMQAIGEGFEILEKSQFDLDFEKVARVWNHGSVIRGWLMELVQNAFSKDKNLEEIKGVIRSSGEGLWTVQEALDLGVPAPVIAQSLLVRYRSEQEDSFSGKVVAALRNEFGGHAVEKK
ncbi:MAG: decarboxylating 6-phosphogluconate dehydrogenase [Epulopiscium sp.]|nr:decarboxylating 6-phosphogluconate dehydrogenase [Candidatus Epulonipiscium sp.]